MEFEGNELSLIHHPTGFVRKLNSANHLSGTQNGDAQGKIITSTQKIGDGRYTAIDQVTLLPGFEATAKDAFLAKIGTVNSYQWQYVLRDHLGNQRALFTDKNGDGSLRQSTDENQNEVLALRNYSAFGLELGGSNQNVNFQNPYKYTGKEENSFTGYYDFGARWADPTIGNRFLQVDILADEFEHLTPHNYGLNNPILMIDPDGMASRYNWETGKYEDSGKEISWESVQQEYGIGQNESNDGGENNCCPDEKTKNESGQSSNKSTVEEPGTMEGLVPIWSSGKQAIHDFQSGDYGWGTFNTVMAISDVFLVKSLATAAGKGVWKLGSHTWKATRKWMLTRGYAESGQPLHHWALSQKTAKEKSLESSHGI